MEGESGSVLNGLRSLQHALDNAEQLQRSKSLSASFAELTTAACSNATYFVGCLNHAKTLAQNRLSLASRSTASWAAQPRSTSNMKRPLTQSRMKMRTLHPGGVRVGILGCGRLGRQLISCLLAYAKVEWRDLLLTTRCVDNLDDLGRLGAHCTSDNASVADQADVLFLCCLPSNVATLAKDIRGHISPQCVVYSLVAATPVSRLKSLLRCSNIIRPFYRMDRTHLQDCLHIQWSQSVEFSPKAVSGGLEVSQRASSISSTHLASARGRGRGGLSAVSLVSEVGGDALEKMPLSIADRLRSRSALRVAFPLSGELLDHNDGLDWMVQLAVCMLNILCNIVSFETALATCNEVLFGLPKHSIRHAGLQANLFHFFLTEGESHDVRVWSAQDDLPLLAGVRQLFMDRQAEGLLQAKHNELFLATIVTIGSSQRSLRQLTTQ